MADFMMEGPPEIVRCNDSDEDVADYVGRFGDRPEDNFGFGPQKPATDDTTNNHVVANGDVISSEVKNEPAEPEIVPETPLIKVRDVMKEHKVPEVVLSLVFWDNVKTSLAVFLISATLLVSLNTMSFISVFAYFNLLVLISVWSLKVYTSVQATLNSKPIEHPLQPWLDYDVKVTPEQISHMSEKVAPILDCGLKDFRAIVLFENSLRTLKVVGIAYLLTYLGAIMNLLTLIFIAFVAAFTVPYVYEMKQREINAFWRMTVAKIYQILNETWLKIEPKLTETYEKLPPVVKNPLSKFLGKPAVKTE